MAIDIGMGNPLGLINTGIDAVKGIYEAYKDKDDKEFNTYISQPFLISSEQDQLITKLREQHFFEKFSYDAQLGGWYLNNPEDGGLPPAAAAGSVTRSEGTVAQELARAAAKITATSVADHVLQLVDVKLQSDSSDGADGADGEAPSGGLDKVKDKALAAAATAAVTKASDKLQDKADERPLNQAKSQPQGTVERQNSLPPSKAAPASQAVPMTEFKTPASAVSSMGFPSSAAGSSVTVQELAAKVAQLELRLKSLEDKANEGGKCCSIS